MRKLKSKKGFTLVEMMVCVVIVILLAMTCGLGMDFAMNSYNTSLFESDSQMLEATIDSFIADILRHSTSVVTEENDYVSENPGFVAKQDFKKVKSFTNSSYKIYSGYIEASERTTTGGGEIQIYKNEGEQVATQLIPHAMYAKYLYVDELVITYNDDTGVYEGFYILKSSIVASAEKICTFAYRRIYN